MKLNKKIKIFIALISLFYCISLIQTTYAKYVSSADANTNITIARWNILVNNQDIKNDSNFSATITPTLEGNNNIAPNIIAPTATGYFDVLINGTETDVSYNYTINVNQSNQNTVTDLKVTKYTVDNDPTEYAFNGPIINSVNNAEQNKIHTYRFFVEWFEGEEETMNNIADTEATKNGIANFNVSVNVIQLAN